MPFAWTQHNPSSSSSNSNSVSTSPQTARPQSSASPAKSGTLRGDSASSHRRNLPQSTSFSSNLSIASSSRSQARPPPSFSVSKSASSTAVTTANGTDDFQQFLDEAQIQEHQQRLQQNRLKSKKSYNLSPGSGPNFPARPGAAESLRRVSSSASIRSGHSQRTSVSPRDASATASSSSRPPAGPAGRVRKDSTISTLSVPRSVSTYSTNFRNPTSQFLQNLSAEAQTPELGLDDTPIIGRAVDNKNHLTALGHAAQLQSRGVSSSTIKGKAKEKPQPAHLPQRSSTAPQSNAIEPSSQVQHGVALLNPSASSTSANSVSSRAALPSSPSQRRQPLSPSKRPQTYLHKSPSESSGVLSPRQLGVSHTAGVPLSPDSVASTMSKRSADEMMSPNPSHSPQTADAKSSSLVQPAMKSPPSRRKTWFGLGRAEAVEEVSAQAQPEPKTSPPDDKASKDEPPPPMNEEEAAFRRSLGMESSYSLGTRPTSGKQDASQSPKAFPTNRDSDATIRALPTQVQARERRVSWIPWRNVPDLVVDPVKEPEKPAETAPTDPVRVDNRDAAAVKPSERSSAEPQNMQVEQKPAPAPKAEAEADGNETVKYRTVLKRGWLGARYEVQEPMPTVQQILNQEAKAPDAVELRPETDTSSAPPQQSINGPEANVAANQSYPPPATGDKPNKSVQNSGTWRWKIWADQPAATSTESAGRHESNEASAEVQRDATTQASSGINDANRTKDHPMDVDVAAPVEGSLNGPPQDGGSWTYSSYLASWVPTWVYNNQPEHPEGQAEAVADSAGSTAARDVEMSSAEEGTPTPTQPRTPAEQVKADALARDASLSPSAIIDANKAVLNQATRSGWIKFFASRSANLPRPMPGRIENQDGMEVMDISDMEEGTRPSSSAKSAVDKQQLASPKQILKTGKDGSGGKNGGRLDPDRAHSIGSTQGGGLTGSNAASRASSVLGADDKGGVRTVTPLSTSKDSIKNLGKAALTKAANVTAASAIGLGKGKRVESYYQSSSNTGTSANGNGNVSNNGGNGNGGNSTDASKGLTPGGGANGDGGGPSRSGASTPTKGAPGPPKVTTPNLVLPSFDDTFGRAPRMWPPKVGMLERTLSAVNSFLFSKVPDLERMKRPTRFSTYGSGDTGLLTGTMSSNGGTLKAKKSTQHLAGKAKATGLGSSKDKGVEQALKEVAESAQRLPRAWSTVGLFDRAQTRGTSGISKIVVIGVHGWFTQSIFKNMLGEPTGTSVKFATMQTESIRRHFLEAGLELNPEAITAISLTGDGKVADRVDRLFSELISRPKWVKDLKEADALFLSAHSQGAIVATQLLARLIEQRHVHADRTKICLLGMCGIHHGPFAHLKSSVTTSYINYFETAAAKELFEFQSSSTPVAQQYTAALKIVLDAGTKCVYVGSTDDNVVPIYSALNSSNNHPSILRALYIDGQAFPKVDFLTNLLVLCVAVRNAGLTDHNLLTLLSASVAGSLYGGRGHSMVYEERAVYDLATRYLFEVTHPLSEPTLVPGYNTGQQVKSGAGSTSSVSVGGGRTNRSVSGTSVESSASASSVSSHSTPVLISEPFEAQRWNPYELPWSLRGLFEDKHVRSLFAEDILELLNSYEQWRPDPKSKTLKDLQWRLAPMRSITRPLIQQEPDSASARNEQLGGKDEVKDADQDTTSGSSSKNAKL